MTFLEFVPVLLAMFIWGESFENKKLKFRIDNNALVVIVNKRTSKSKKVMKLMRPFVFITMKHNIQFRAVYIKSTRNSIADSLSRFQMARFRTLAPSADREPVNIPQSFLNVISELDLKNF